MSRLPRMLLITVAASTAMIGLSALAKDTAVGVRDSYYGKPLVVLTVGDTVTWRNQGGIGHTVVTYGGAPRSFDSSPGTEDNCRPLLGSADCIEPGDTYAITFTEPGTYDYFCKITGHADPSVRPDPNVSDGREQPCGMCGQIVVNEKRAAPSPTREPERPSEPTVAPSPDGSESPSPTASPTATATGPDGSPIAIDETPTGGEEGSGGRLVLAFGAIVVLGGTGWFVWRRYLSA